MRNIKKEKELRKGKMFYRVMIKSGIIFKTWGEEFGSFSKVETDDAYRSILRCPNIHG
jgi:hypothetical protein